MPPISLFENLKNLIENKKVFSDRAEYVCVHIDERCTIFAESDTTRKVMIPTDLIIEWVSAYNLGIIISTMSAREMREKIAPKSDWARYQHGFETHLKAVVYTWAEYKSHDH